MTTIVESTLSTAEMFVGAIGAEAELVTSIDALRPHLEQRPDEFAVVLGPGVNLQAAISLAETLRVSHPALSVILLRERVESQVLSEAMRSGMREVVEVRDLTALVHAVRRARILFKALTADGAGTQNNNALGRLVTVFAAKGGVGKTTMSTNLAVALSTMGHRVCLVDLDLASGDVAIALRMFPHHSITETTAIVGEISPDELRPLLTSYSENLSALLAPPRPDPAEAHVKKLVGSILATLKKSFDYVVVDTPPAFDDQVLQAFDESDLLLLVATPDAPALKNLRITLEMLALLNVPREKCRVVLNRAGGNVGMTSEDIEQTLKAEIFAAIPAAHEVPAAINRGEPIVTSLPRHPASLALLAMARGTDQAISGSVAHAAAPGQLSRDDKRRLFPGGARKHKSERAFRLGRGSR
jgi:pilus assembly protein CpaE